MYSIPFLLQAVRFIARNKKIKHYELWPPMAMSTACFTLSYLVTNYFLIITFKLCSAVLWHWKCYKLKVHTYYQMLQFDTEHSSTAYSHPFPLCGMQCLPNIDFLNPHQHKWDTGTQPSRKSIN